MKKTKGRVALDGVTVRRAQVMLDEETVQRAKALGDGNISMGLRRAVKDAVLEKYIRELAAAGEPVAWAHFAENGNIRLWAPERPRELNGNAAQPLYTADQLAAAVAAERERCIGIIESHHIPVGNSAAGELASEWTYDALKTISDAIRAGAA